MKKINAFLLIALLSVFAINVSAKTITLVAGNNVGTTLTAATTVSGDIIELSQEGTYVWNAQASVGAGTVASHAPKSITIRAAAGLATRPIVQCQAAAPIFAFALYKTDGSEIVLDGIDFDGNSKSSYLWVIKSYNLDAAPIAPKFNVTINNCKFRNFIKNANATAMVISYSNLAGVTAPGDLTITNSYFENIQSGVNYVDGAGHAVNYVITNCYFKGAFEKGAFSNLTTGTNEVKSYSFDHCTFDGNNTRDLSLVNIAGDATSTTSISNSLFLNNTGTTPNVLGTGGNLATKCGVFGATDAATVYPTAVADLAFTSDPVLSNLFATGTDYYNNGTDGKTIGFYGAPAFTTSVPKSATVNNFTVSQSGANFTVKGIADAAYTVYSVSGSQVAAGVIVGGNFQLAANKGIYILKSNGQIAKFAVR